MLTQIQIKCICAGVNVRVCVCVPTKKRYNDPKTSTVISLAYNGARAKAIR